MKAVVMDLARLMTRPPSVLRFVKSYFLDKGFQAVVLYRLAHWLVNKKIKIIASLVTNHSLSKTGAEIQPYAQIGPGFLVKHPVGLVIGSGCRIGRDFTVLQGVTLGEKNVPDGKYEYPIIGDQVTICAGAKVLGAVRIGSGSIVGANAVVIHDVPLNVMVAGVPARMIRELGTSPFMRSGMSGVHNRVSQVVRNGEGGSLLLASGRKDGDSG